MEATRHKRLSALSWIAIASSLAVMFTILAGCERPFGLGQSTYYDAQVPAHATAVATPLTLEVWRVDYLTSTPPATQVHLRLENGGTSAITLFQTAFSPDGTPPPPPPYYLVDQEGHRYRDTGTGWSNRGGDPRAVMGKALPGQTVEFSLEFGGITANVRSLQLVMPTIRAADGTEYRLQVPVPVPKAADGV